jgi:hypothetical protein
VARFLLPALHPAEADVAQVLDPFEVGHGHAARVGVEVGDDDRALLAQDVVGARRDRAVGGLDDQGRADAVGVAEVDHALERGGNEEVALGLEQRRAILDIGAAGEALHAAVSRDPLPHGLDVEPVLVHERAVALDDGDDLRAVLLRQELRRVVAHVAEALHDHPLALERPKAPRARRPRGGGRTRAARTGRRARWPRPDRGCRPRGSACR